METPQPRRCSRLVVRCRDQVPLPSDVIRFIGEKMASTGIRNITYSGDRMSFRWGLLSWLPNWWPFKDISKGEVRVATDDGNVVVYYRMSILPALALNMVLFLVFCAVIFLGTRGRDTTGETLVWMGVSAAWVFGIGHLVGRSGFRGQLTKCVRKSMECGGHNT
jgi:hypothetical protein